MLDFNEMIGNFLKQELRPKEIGRYYPSEAGNCLRKTWYSYKQPKETDKELIKVFEVGNMIHDFVVDVIKSERNAEVELLGAEVPFRFTEGAITISGRIDDIILVKIAGKQYIVEVKSTSALKYTKEPSEGHVMQLQIYMRQMGVHNGIILYVEKNTLQSKWFETEYDAQKAEYALSRFRNLHSHLAENKLPAAEAKLVNEMNWQCKSCQYAEECAAAGPEEAQ